MKRTIKAIICLALMTGGMTSCLSDLNSRVDTLEEQVSGLLSSVSQLEDYIKSQVYVSQVSSNDDGYVLKLSNGETLQIKNGKDGEDGKSVVDGIAGITAVSITEDYVVFFLEDGGKLALPRNPKSINIEFTSTVINAYDGKAEFEITDACDPYVLVFGDADMKIEVSEVVDGKGCISFTRGEAGTAKLYATVIDNASSGNNTNTKVLKVNFETSAMNADARNFSVPANGGELSFTFSTNCPYKLELPEWISSTETKAMTEHEETVRIAANSGIRRSGNIRVIDSRSNKAIGYVRVSQKGEQTYLFILNEGQWGANNASLSRYDFVSKAFVPSFYKATNGSALGDVANDIIVTDDNIIIAVNGSNIIQFCDAEGKAVAQSEDVPNCRKMAVDENGEYLYVTSYANDGYVAKIDLTSYKVVGTAEVGYEPEGIAWRDGKLYVANSGGNAYLGTHDYEQTISVIDAESMEEIKRVDTGMCNLYGAFVQSDTNPAYILVNASGDYMTRPAGCLIFDCETESVIGTYDFPATYATVRNGIFYVLGSSFSYITYGYDYSFRTITMEEGKAEVIEGLVSSEVEEGISGMTSPYGIHIASNGYLFVGDAGDYMARGTVTVFSPFGKKVESIVAGVCPGHFFEQ